MRVQIDERDIVVLVTAYGQKIVRENDWIDSEVYVLTTTDDDGESDVILWRGNLGSCIEKLGEDLSVTFAQEPVWKTPAELIVGGLKKAV